MILLLKPNLSSPNYSSPMMNFSAFPYYPLQHYNSKFGLPYGYGNGNSLNSQIASNYYHGIKPYRNPYRFRGQDFDYFVVMDFEATCDKDKIPNPQEIIEFPSVIVNAATGEIESVFQTYVRPTHNQQLSEFCKDLTGIQQDQVDSGVTLSEAILYHDLWLERMGIKKTKFAVVTWGDWDCKVMLESECKYKKIRKPDYFNRWINLRIPFREVFGYFKCNFKEAVEISGLKWEGRAHSGLDDAKNTANLLVLLMQKGVKFSITDFVFN